MDTQIKTIKSDNEISIQNHIKISAGPGAGKTTFLSNHVKKIVKESEKISMLRKVGCITYTNVAVESLKNKLGTAVDYVEIATIHNFLYNHILKPYLWVLNKDYEFNFEKISGHEDVIPTFSIVNSWLEKTKQLYLNKSAGSSGEIAQKLKKIRWELDENDNPILGFSENWQAKIGSFYIKKDSLIQYKKVCWAKGLIDHDDVLFLSLEILKKNVRILDIIRAKFPYIMIDEFQDTNAIQSMIIKKIAEEETIIGVIGDECQSIYGFAGAKVDEFIDFQLESLQEYKIIENNRSTTEIVNVLNYVAADADMKQFSPNKKSGAMPVLLIGSVYNAFRNAKSLVDEEEILTIAYRKDDPNKLKYGVESIDSDKLKLKLLFEDDKRGRKIFYVIQSLEYGKEGRYNESLKAMLRAYRKEGQFSEADSLKNLQCLLNNYNEFFELSLKDFYNKYLAGYHNTKAKITRGKKAEFYSEIKYKDIACSIDLNETTSLFRTIHKAKGDEAENVLLIIENKKNFEEEKELKFLLNPSIKKDEDDRVYFVGLSRAKRNLFINIPTLSKENKLKIEKLNLFTINYL
ncbi:ATP-dependent helicase [Listeria monocytogenes]|nr:ATP-dependent helicase [Listeria monocytogenes]